MGAGAVLCAAALAAVPLVRGSDAVLTAGLRVDLVALLLLATALVVGWSPLIPASLVALGGVYAAQLAVDDAALDALAPAFAAGLLVTAELAYWSLEERENVQAEPGEGFRRIAFLAALGMAALIVASVLLVLVDWVSTRGLAVDILGATAAAATLVAVVLVARRTRDA